MMLDVLHLLPSDRFGGSSLVAGIGATGLKQMFLLGSETNFLHAHEQHVQLLFNCYCIIAKMTHLSMGLTIICQEKGGEVDGG